MGQLVSALYHRPQCNIHDLPPELLDQIMFFLPPSSILHLMVNRKLRSVCEPYLYRNIDVGNHPHRSLYLLKTFALVPNQALLVRQLRINLAWCFSGLKAKYKITPILQADGLAALSLAKNIRSLELAGLYWLSDPSLAHICDMVAQMELTSLTIEEPLYYISTEPRTVQLLTSNLRSALLSQPKLEYLSLKFLLNKPALLNNIEAGDVPHLNRFRGEARFARAFLNAASKLSTLDLFFEFDEPSYDPFRESWNGINIKTLRIEMRFKDVPDWAVFGDFLANFPNTESLQLLSRDLGNEDHIPRYSDHIAPHYLGFVSSKSVLGSACIPRTRARHPNFF